MRYRVSASIVIVVAVLVPAMSARAAEGDVPRAKGGPASSGKVVKTEREWAKQLTQAQFFVTRRKATEPAFSGKLLRNHALGIYACVCCGQPLFNSRAKFESGTGWPSFWTPLSPDRIQTAPDFHEAEPRVEVMCSRCDAHLGHVFEDGPPPTGLRFCLNSIALKFIPETRAKPKATAKAAPAPKPDSTPTPDSSTSSTPPTPPAP